MGVLLAAAVLLAPCVALVAPGRGAPRARGLVVAPRPRGEAAAARLAPRAAQGGGGTDPQDPPQDPDARTPAGVAALLEVTFVEACKLLSTGKVDTLKLFIASALSAYESGFPVPTLELELSMVERQTAGRPLLAEELELRSAWLALVYLTLQEAGHPLRPGVGDAADSVPDATRAKFRRLVAQVVAKHQAGLGFDALNVDDFVDAGQPRDPVEKAILRQSMRLAFLTLVVRDETEAARGSKSPPPGPSIPGIR